MSHVMVSYKREDEARVARLVRALQSHGLDVWWDQTLPGGESWRDNITVAVEGAGCVVAAWTRGSVGPEGGFVRDEAGRAKARDVLVPVRLDDVEPPLGFGELQAIDLRHWKGDAKDPFLADLVAACRAKLDGQPVPPAKGPTSRLFRRARLGSLAAAGTAVLWSLAANFEGVQNRICTIPIAQPQISDACGGLGLGRRPSRAERLDWAARAKGSCADLRAHIVRFPNGAYRSEAAACWRQQLLSVRRPIRPTRGRFAAMSASRIIPSPRWPPPRPTRGFGRRRTPPACVRRSMTMSGSMASR